MATLMRLLGDLDLAEDCLQTAFEIALDNWPREGIPKNPFAWLISTARFKGIDAIRRKERYKELLREQNLSTEETLNIKDKPVIEDDHLRLIFFCCHPLLSIDARIALSLREICGMRTKEIAKAYLLAVETVKKRITRAKSTLRDNNIPFQIPPTELLPQRLSAVLHTIYLVYNEGYAASFGKSHLRTELSNEAIYLARKLAALIPSGECYGLLALLLYSESRRKARIDEHGDIVPLAEQDRHHWDQNMIQEAGEMLWQAFLSGRLGPYTLQAAIASVHASAATLQDTRWDTIVEYYNLLLKINPSAIIRLNRAIALGMAEGPQSGLLEIDKLIAEQTLKSYHRLFAAQAQFLKQTGQIKKAENSYRRAIALATQEREISYLRNQLDELAK